MSYFKNIGVRSLARELVLLAREKGCELQRTSDGWQLVRNGCTVIPLTDLRSVKDYLEKL